MSEEIQNKSTPTDKDIDLLDRRIQGLATEVKLLRQLLEELRLQQYVQALLSPRHMMWSSLLRGIFSGLGAVLGGTVILALLLYILSHMQIIPYIGDFISEIIKVVRKQT